MWSERAEIAWKEENFVGTGLLGEPRRGAANHAEIMRATLECAGGAQHSRHPPPHLAKPAALAEQHAFAQEVQ